MENRIKRLEHVIDGNGQPGLVQKVAEIAIKQEDMSEDLKSIAVSIKALAKSQVEQDIIKKQKAESNKEIANAIKIVGGLVTICGTLLATAYLIVDHLPA